MSSAPIVTAFETKRARKNRWCKVCGGRIPAGSFYASVDAWTWVHIGCSRKAVQSWT